MTSLGISTPIIGLSLIAAEQLIERWPLPPGPDADGDRLGGRAERAGAPFAWWGRRGSTTRAVLTSPTTVADQP